MSLLHFPSIRIIAILPHQHQEQTENSLIKSIHRPSNELAGCPPPLAKPKRRQLHPKLQLRLQTTHPNPIKPHPSLLPLTKNTDPSSLGPTKQNPMFHLTSSHKKGSTILHSHLTTSTICHQYIGVCQSRNHCQLSEI